jgi:hypothetical protein
MFDEPISSTFRVEDGGRGSSITGYKHHRRLQLILETSTIFCDIIITRSLLKANWHFRGAYWLHLQGRRISWERNQGECSWQAEHTFNGLHGVISQKKVLFIATALRTSDPTFGDFPTWFQWTCTYHQEHRMSAVRKTTISEATTIYMFLCYMAFLGK